MIDEFLEDTLKVSFIDRLHYNNVKKIMTSILFNNEYNEPSDKNRNNNKNKTLNLKKTINNNNNV